MRELKFRVWFDNVKRGEKKGDEIVWSTQSYYDYSPIIDNGGLLEVEGGWDIYGNSDENYTIEQYTGLKDKNGKEIYEGDIVRTKSCDQPNFSAGAIEMVQQMYLIMNSAHYRDPEISHCEPLGHYCDTELEVIGNIHENPELCGEEEE